MTFGFDGARGTSVRPAHKASVSSWAKDESAPGANDGTVLTSSWANRLVGNIRRLAVRAGISLTETSDDDLADCVLAMVNTRVVSASETQAGIVELATVAEVLAGLDTARAVTPAGLAAAVAALVDAAPGALDTLNELAAALGDDANYAATMTTALAGKQPLAATLTALAAVTLVADRLIYTDGSGTPVLAALTAAGRALLDDANADAQLTTLGLSANGASLVKAANYAAMKTLLAFAISDVTGLQSALDAKAPLASPALTGTPTVPTASPGTNTTQAASTAFVTAAVAAVPGLTDGDKGDITVSGSGATWAVDGNAITYAKMQDISATSRILGRKTAGAGDPEEVTLSELLDFIGSAARGDILFRGASAWQRLAAGTSGHLLQSGGTGGDPSWTAPPSSGFASGTRTLFQQTAAPTGWTKDTNATYNDKALRLTTGTVGTGGSNSFTAAMVNSFNSGATTLTTSQIPSHTHGGVVRSSGGDGYETGATFTRSNGSTDSAGTGGSHNHTVQLNVAYVDFIVATKD